MAPEPVQPPVESFLSQNLCRFFSHWLSWRSRGSWVCISVWLSGVLYKCLNYLWCLCFRWELRLLTPTDCRLQAKRHSYSSSSSVTTFLLVCWCQKRCESVHIPSQETDNPAPASLHYQTWSRLHLLFSFLLVLAENYPRKTACLRQGDILYRGMPQWYISPY